MTTTDKDIQFISPLTGEVSFADEWYGAASADHFWFEWRFNVLMCSLRDMDVNIEAPLKVMEVGCGTGILIKQLEQVTQWRIDGVDLNLSVLQKAVTGRGRKLFYDIRQECKEYLETYDIVLLFDIIEHIPDDAGLVLSAVRHLKPGGLLMINVPALSLFLGAYDKATGHLRRYDKVSLNRVLDGVPLMVRDIRYWGGFLVPLLFLRNRILRRPNSVARTVECGFRPPNNAVNRLLKLAMKLETRLIARVPIGASLMLIGSRT
ncbi:MAG: class I SAM-dependent methyltransferase [Desulfomonilaceae bacterium]|nr:class I SAM-dependent methyltransferase [Desulfomonilaceae bacterium]